MGNGQPRIEKYARLSVEDHLRMLDNDMDSNDYGRQLIIDKMNRKLNWILTTFVSILLVGVGTLIAAVIR